MTTLLVSALSQALAIAALGLAFALVYWSTRVFFVALGALCMLAPLLVWKLQDSFGLLLAGLIAIFCSTSLALLAGWANHEQLIRRGASDGAHFTSSLALYFLIAELMALAWGTEGSSLANLPALTQFVSGRSWGLPNALLTALLGNFALVFLFLWALHASDYGTKLRALADNAPELARSGYNPILLRVMAFAGSGLAAGLSGIAVAMDSGLGAHSGMQALIPAVTAVLLTRAGRWNELLAWAVGLGFLRASTLFLFSGAWQDPVTLSILLVVQLGRRGAFLPPRATPLAKGAER